MNDNGLKDGNDLDIAGWSHSGGDALAQLHTLKPTMPQLLSECCSCPSQRSYMPGMACIKVVHTYICYAYVVHTYVRM